MFVLVKHTSYSPEVVISSERKERVQSSFTKTSHLLKSIKYLSKTENNFTKTVSIYNQTGSYGRQENDLILLTSSEAEVFVEA